MDLTSAERQPPAIGRDEILRVLDRALSPRPEVQAMWEGGAAALGRVDVYSDIDLQVAVDDPQVDAIWPAIESALAAISPIEIKYELPRHTWHVHAQAF